MRKPKRTFIGITVISIILFFLCIEFILRLLPAPFLYFRPHEALCAYDPLRQDYIFKKNTKMTMIMHYGDLAAMDKRYRSPDIAEARKVLQIDDSYGFRNSRDYHGQEYLLVGDSFIVGSADTQEDILSEQLERDYGIDTYNLAMMGNIRDYKKRVDMFQKDHKNNFKILLFLFEGNNFPLEHVNNDASFRQDTLSRKIYSRFRRYLQKSYIWKLLYLGYYTIVDVVKDDQKSNAVLLRIKDRDIKLLEYDRYIDVTRSEIYHSEEFAKLLESIRDKIKHIYFISTKYRVYYDLLEKEIAGPLPNARWEYLNALAKRLKIPCMNLTEPFVMESKKLLQENKLTYWKDDTHWNKYGIAVAAKVVYESLQ